MTKTGLDCHKRTENNVPPTFHQLIIGLPYYSIEFCKVYKKSINYVYASKVGYATNDVEN